MSGWNGLDFFIFLIFFVNTILGMSRGATKEIISLMCLSAALIFTIKFTVPLAQFLNRSPAIQDVLDSQIIQRFVAAIGANPLTANFLAEVSYSVSVLICFVGIFSVTEAVLSVTGFVEVFSFPYATLNRKVGAALGATRGYVINLIFIMILSLHLFKNDNNAPLISGSHFINLFQAAAVKLDGLIQGQEVERYQEIYQDKNLYNEKDVFKVIPQFEGSPPNNPAPPAPQ